MCLQLKLRKYLFLEISMPFQFLSCVSLGVVLGMNSNQDAKYFLKLIFIPRENTQKPAVSEFKESHGFPNRRELIFYVIVPKRLKIHFSPYSKDKRKQDFLFRLLGICCFWHRGNYHNKTTRKVVMQYLKY